MKKLLALLLISTSSFAEEFIIEKQDPYGYNRQETYIVREKTKPGRLSAREAFKNDLDFDHVLVTDSDYAIIYPRENDKNCVDTRNEILAKLESQLPPNMDQFDRLKYLAYVRMDCVILKSMNTPTKTNGYERTLAFYVNRRNELYVFNNPGWLDCITNHDDFAMVGEFYSCKSTKQLY